ncbi:hypothetical protein G4B88_005484 [Cannabis sativa]|uniref:Uncharacterized protein n=1 Tax=Cannabis sativa TaxID=3483 RepID=A0A7J6HBT3_CANSA|nr:hypothetical protein G4B88_005484 [Cannabis sativa]
MDLQKTKYIRLDYVNFIILRMRGSCVLKNKNDSDNWLVNGFWSPETESAMFRDDLTTGVRYRNLFDVVVDVVI